MIGSYHTCCIRRKNHESGILDREHEIVPSRFRKVHERLYIAMVVGHVDKDFEIAAKENFIVVESRQDIFYGQIRLLWQDPHGALADISASIENFRF